MNLETRTLVILTTILAVCFFCGAAPAMLFVNSPGLAGDLAAMMPEIPPTATFTVTPVPTATPTSLPTETPIPTPSPQLEEVQVEPLPTLRPVVTARRVPLPETPTPTPAPTWTLVPSRTPTLWSISTVPAWPVVNPTFTPWIGPTATARGGGGSGSSGDEETSTDDNDVNDENDDADDDKGSGPCSCLGNLYNCEPDFDNNQPAAQACFDHCLVITGRDIHELDADDDGNACENE